MVVLDRTCHDPPEPKQVPNIGGATYDWDNNTFANNGTPFGTIIAYRCDIARAIYDPVKNETVENQEIECQWDHTYLPKTVNQFKINEIIHPKIHNIFLSRGPNDIHEKLVFSCIFLSVWW